MIKFVTRRQQDYAYKFQTIMLTMMKDSIFHFMNPFMILLNLARLVQYTTVYTYEWFLYVSCIYDKLANHNTPSITALIRPFHVSSFMPFPLNDYEDVDDAVLLVVFITVPLVVVVEEVVVTCACATSLCSSLRRPSLEFFDSHGMTFG